MEIKLDLHRVWLAKITVIYSIQKNTLILLDNQPVGRFGKITTVEFGVALTPGVSNWHGIGHSAGITFEEASWGGANGLAARCIITCACKQSL